MEGIFSKSEYVRQEFSCKYGNILKMELSIGWSRTQSGCLIELGVYFLQRFIEFLFGRVNKENRFLTIAYWAFVLFYFISVVFLAIQQIGWVLLMPVILFPVMFRIVYGLVGFGAGKLHSKKWIWLAGGIVVFIAGFAGAMFLFADNVAINASKSMSNGNVEVSIGTLKGSYEVAEYDVTSGGILSIPYEAAVAEGIVSLTVEKGNEVLWKENIPASGEGNIEFQAEPGTYDIIIVTEEAKDVFIELSSP